MSDIQTLREKEFISAKDVILNSIALIPSFIVGADGLLLIKRFLVK